MSRPSLGFGWILALPCLAGCEKATGARVLGYVEGDYVYVASSQPGTIDRLAVSRGTQVERDAALFSLEPDPERLRLAETEQRILQAHAKVADLGKGGRPTELAAIEARLAGARAVMERLEREYARRKELVQVGRPEAVSAEELDRVRSELDVQRAQVSTYEAELETARLGGRSDAIDAARLEVTALEALREQIRWALDEKTVESPAAGLVQDTLYHVGEFVPAGRPVVSLLPPENVELRFFVPQAALPDIHVGDTVEVRVDGLGRLVSATVTFISTEAEFTPPVIYSREAREKLVFMVEAAPEASAIPSLRPGQPIEVTRKERADVER